MRDLVWLLINTTAHHTRDQLSDYPEVRRSVINYGIPVLSQHFSALTGESWSEEFTTPSLAFEPRILPDSLKVTAIAPVDNLGHHNLLQFELRGELWSIPFLIELLIRSELDLETGRNHRRSVDNRSRIDGSADARLL